ncbi:hypothetical protein SUGI_0043310 [Cryptomeria japonica]|uniref:endochitinase 4-like n=1 Tax=Cryptomeria japonica TaxID=3369 RepID=UPI002408F0B5|nr:endochitinase 4-like [Cryptomeria japonica]GLJ06624.1 hypothetical protein SUGI_0043310 [Cryptomeria japonica]
MATYTRVLLLMMVTLIIAGEIQISLAQNCGCSKGLCCSRWGFCGTTQLHCGEGCQEGPCTLNTTASPASFRSIHSVISKAIFNRITSGISSGSIESIINQIFFNHIISGISAGSIESIISQTFFNDIKSGVSASCEGYYFYTYNGFIDAAKAKNFAGFGNTGSLDVRKRELAAFFANVAHETGSLCYVEEIAKATYCEPSTRWLCASGKQYYGRGPLQLTWNYNYGAAGEYVGLPLLNNPDLVAQKPDIAFKTSIWFWMINSNCHKAMTSPDGKGFSGTIRAINGGECGGGSPSAVQNRVNLYKKFCGLLDVTTGPNLSC